MRTAKSSQSMPDHYLKILQVGAIWQFNRPFSNMSPLFDPELGRRISDCGIVAVLILDRVEDAVQVARSLRPVASTPSSLLSGLQRLWKR